MRVAGIGALRRGALLRMVPAELTAVVVDQVEACVATSNLLAEGPVDPAFPARVCPRGFHGSMMAISMYLFGVCVLGEQNSTEATKL